MIAAAGAPVEGGPIGAASGVGLADLQGLWRRRWLRTPVRHDAATRVLWMQGGEHHVDLRLPEGCDALAAAPSLAALDADGLRLLARAEGFAGTTALAGDVCTWTRRINLQGPPAGVDAGALGFTSEGLLETGVNGDYEELWVHESGEVPRGRRMTSADGELLVLLRTAGRFAFGRGRPAAMRGGPALGERVDAALAANDVVALGRAFDQEFCIGSIVDGRGVVEHSTQPTRRGSAAFEIGPVPDDGVLELAVQSFAGAERLVRFAG